MSNYSNYLFYAGIDLVTNIEPRFNPQNTPLNQLNSRHGTGREDGDGKCRLTLSGILH